MRQAFSLTIATISAIYAGYQGYHLNSVYNFSEDNFGPPIVFAIIFFFVIGCSVEGTIELIANSWSDAKASRERHQFVAMTISFFSLLISAAALYISATK